jgi:hypothetical protein
MREYFSRATPPPPLNHHNVLSVFASGGVKLYSLKLRLTLHKETNFHYSVPTVAIAHSITNVHIKRETIKLIKTLNNLCSVHFTYTICITNKRT